MDPALWVVTHGAIDFIFIGRDHIVITHMNHRKYVSLSYTKQLKTHKKIGPNRNNMPHNVKSECQKIMRQRFVWKKNLMCSPHQLLDCTNVLKGIVQFCRSGSFLKMISVLPFSTHYLSIGQILLRGSHCSCTKNRWLGALHNFCVRVHIMSICMSMSIVWVWV